MNLLYLVLIALLTGFSSALIAAEGIRLSLETGTVVEADSATITLKITNVGAAPAMNVEPRITLDNKAFHFPRRETLHAHERYKATIPLTFEDQNWINLFSPVEINYVDSTGYPATTLLLAQFRRNQATVSPLELQLHPVTLRKKCVLSRLSIRNTSAEDIHADIQLIAPSFITPPVLGEPLKIPASSTLNIRAPLCSETLILKGTLEYFAIATTQTPGGQLSATRGAPLVLDQLSPVSRAFSEKKIIYVVIAIAISILILLAILQIFGERRQLR